MTTGNAAPVSRVKVVASAAFFVTYLAFHLIYPAMAWFDPSYNKFTWQMYSGRDEELHFTVEFVDGSRRDTGNPLKVGSAIRVLGPSIDQRRVVPPWLCEHWEGAKAVLIREGITGREDVITCQPID